MSEPPTKRRVLPSSSKHATREAAMADRYASRMVVFKPHSGGTGHDQ